LLLLLSWHRHISVRRVLSQPQFARLTARRPLLSYKYLGNYVALGLPLAARRSIFVGNYQFLQRKFNDSFIACMDSVPVTVWRTAIGRSTFDVAFGLNGVRDREGDLLLDFHMDGSLVYRLMFVFAPGRDFHLADETVIVVAAVQGVPDFERVRLATKTCCDIQPAQILMAALGAIAELVGVSTLLGLHQSRQLVGERVLFAYDRFFEIYGSEFAGQRTYLIKVPYLEKSIAEIERCHRKRTLRKRAFKGHARRQVLENLRRYLA
jgi:uncharacterized protein